VIEHLLEQSLTEFGHTRVLEPFGMRLSSFVWREAYDTQAAQGHDEENQPVENNKPFEPNAAYAMHTTPSDRARFMINSLQPTTAVSPTR